MNRDAKLEILIVLMTIIIIFIYETVFVKGNIDRIAQLMLNGRFASAVVR